MPYYLGIDTSNYTTSLALCDAQGNIVAQQKKLLQVKPGSRGLRQSEAVFQHLQNLPALSQALFADVPQACNYLSAIGYSQTPRPISGSYMPCFVPGETFSNFLCAYANLPCYPFSHQEGHIMAALYSAHAMHLLNRTFLAFHISGGTTDLLAVQETESGMQITPLATSQDLHAGQLIDRVGVMLNLPFPCGPALEKLANDYRGKPFSPKICVRNGSCHLSGAENQAKALFQSGASPEAVAAYVFTFLQNTICKMICEALQTHPSCPVLFVGGVMSNQFMRPTLQTICDAHFAAPNFSADNAAGTALLAYRSHLANISSSR